MTKRPDPSARQAAQEERRASARLAWDDYQNERELVARRTEKLRAQRLAAEAVSDAKPPKAEG
jgi:hypothetical protein